MIDLGILALVIWIGCFVVVSVDSAYKKIDPVFWRLATLFGGPFTLIVYGIIRERRSNQ